jgi:hypothetical protein
MICSEPGCGGEATRRYQEAYLDGWERMDVVRLKAALTKQRASERNFCTAHAWDYARARRAEGYMGTQQIVYLHAEVASPA